MDGCPPSRHQGGVGRADYVLPNPTGLSEGGVRAGNRPRGSVPGAQGRAGGADRASFFVDLYFAGSVSSVVTGRRSCLGRRPRSCVGVRARAAPLASYVDLDCGCSEFVYSGVWGGGLVCVLLLRASGCVGLSSVSRAAPALGRFSVGFGGEGRRSAVSASRRKHNVAGTGHPCGHIWPKLTRK